MLFTIAGASGIILAFINIVLSAFDRFGVKLEMRFISKIAVIICLLTLAGCASMFNGSTQLVNATSSDGKLVKTMVTNGESTYYSNIPASIAAIHDANGVSFLIKDKNYQASTYAVPKNITPSFWANFLSPFFIGFVIDAATGDMWTYPSNVIVPVTPKN